MQASLRDRTVSALAATLIVAGGVLALVMGLSFVPGRGVPDRALEAILPARNSPPTPPSPTPSPEPQRIDQGAPPEDPAPAGMRNDAAQIVLPPPEMPPLITPPPVPVSTAAGAGSAANQGAARSDGAARGAGGVGSGSGGGGNGGRGTGAGAGQGNLSAYPRQTSGKLHYHEIPRELRRDHSGVIRLRYRIGIDGRVSDCSVIQSSGLPDFDRATCARITQRFRFKPARDLEGRPIPFVMNETHGWDYQPGA